MKDAELMWTGQGFMPLNLSSETKHADKIEGLNSSFLFTLPICRTIYEINSGLLEEEEIKYISRNFKLRQSRETEYKIYNCCKLFAHLARNTVLCKHFKLLL